MTFGMYYLITVEIRSILYAPENRINGCHDNHAAFSSAIVFIFDDKHIKV